ncbi:MAG: hypothetical protein C0485_11410 [Pirellula sp.]|nr:hypothetical protein [Pirellula sp.]
MNKTVIIAALTIAACGLSSTVRAAPAVSYNPVNGGIWFHNDTGAPLANVSILSLSGNLKSASFALNIAGATKDDSELPFALTYLGLPVGQSFAGYVVQPNTNCFSMSFEYRTASLIGPPIRGTMCMPEPSSWAMIAAPAVAFLGAARRARGWRRDV